MNQQFIGLSDVERASVQFEALKKGLTPLEFMELHEQRIKEKNTKVWPKHKPETTLHEIVMDGVKRDFTEEQIIEETLGLSDSKMISFYRKSFDLDMKLDYEYNKGYERGLWLYQREREISRAYETKYFELLNVFAKYKGMSAPESIVFPLGGGSGFKVELTDYQKKQLTTDVSFIPGLKGKE